MELRRVIMRLSKAADAAGLPPCAAGGVQWDAGHAVQRAMIQVGHRAFNTIASLLLEACAQLKFAYFRHAIAAPVT